MCLKDIFKNLFNENISDDDTDNEFDEDEDKLIWLDEIVEDDD